MANIQCENCNKVIKCSYGFDLLPRTAVLAMVSLRVICPKCNKDIEVNFIPLRNDIKDRIDYIPLTKPKEEKKNVRRKKEPRPNYIA